MKKRINYALLIITILCLVIAIKLSSTFAKKRIFAVTIQKYFYIKTPSQ